MSDNFSIDFQIPKGLTRELTILTSDAGKKVIRDAIKTAARPAHAGLRKEVRLLRAASDASSGASFNAIVSKHSYPSKGNPSYGYFYVGVDMGYSEQHMPNRPLETATLKARMKRAAIHRDKFVGFSNRYRRRLPGNSSFKKELIRSYQKTPLRRRRGQKVQNNVPAMYWHLLEDGFTHKSGTKFSGYHFRRNTAQATAAASTEAFDRLLAEGFQRESARS